MTGRATPTVLIAVLAAATLISGCGGGGDAPKGQTAVQPGAAAVLEWTPPATYNDNTAMDPFRDLDCYELYLRQDNRFSDADPAAVQVAAVSEDHVLITQFDLQAIPQIPQGSRLYVSMRAIGIDGQKSAFMTPVPWDRI